jgi:hypothetical protein
MALPSTPIIADTPKRLGNAKLGFGEGGMKQGTVVPLKLRLCDANGTSCSPLEFQGLGFD